MKVIPVSPTPSQQFSIVLGDQNCKLKLYQKSTGMFLDVSLNGQPLLSAILCQDRVKLIRQQYFGFVGDLAFMDTQGHEAPRYEGLGTRWVFMYLEKTDI